MEHAPHMACNNSNSNTNQAKAGSRGGERQQQRDVARQRHDQRPTAAPASPPHTLMQASARLGISRSRIAAGGTCNEHQEAAGRENSERSRRTQLSVEDAVSVAAQTSTQHGHHTYLADDNGRRPLV